MTKKKKHIDEDLDMRVPPKLSADLNTIFKPQFTIPPEVDRAVMERANRHFVKRHRRSRLLRWAGSVAAAAAIIIFAFVLDSTKRSGQTVSHPEYSLTKESVQSVSSPDYSLSREAGPTVSSLSNIVAQTDIDRNGRVDILDAFKLARRIEIASGSAADLDINGDGLANYDDVDAVALAAVSLNKGVL